MKLGSFAKAAVLAAVLAATGVVSAQTITRDVALSVTLTSQCRLAPSDPDPTLAFGTYVAFRATALDAASQSITFQCTRSYAPTPTLTWTGGASGTIAGLRYDLDAVAAAPTGGTEPAIATPGDVGTPATRVITVSGSMPALQAGTNGATATATKTLTVVF